MERGPYVATLRISGRLRVVLGLFLWTRGYWPVSFRPAPTLHIRACSRNEWLGWLLSRSATSSDAPSGRAPTRGIYRVFS
jgi:hypothetical protein